MTRFAAEAAADLHADQFDLVLAQTRAHPRCRCGCRTGPGWSCRSSGCRAHRARPASRAARCSPGGPSGSLYVRSTITSASAKPASMSPRVKRIALVMLSGSREMSSSSPAMTAPCICRHRPSRRPHFLADHRRVGLHGGQRIDDRAAAPCTRLRRARRPRRRLLRSSPRTTATAWP